MITLSSNHVGHDDQVRDTLRYISTEYPAKYAEFVAQFPEWETLQWSPPMSSLDTELNGVDVEYTSWVTDWIENNTSVTWWEGEPVIIEEGDDDEDDALPLIDYDPFTMDGVQAVGGQVTGWAGTMTPIVFHASRNASRWVDDQVSYWTKYTDDIEFMYYGYDPNVYTDRGEVIGTDGAPDAMGKYNPVTELVEWVRT